MSSAQLAEVSPLNSERRRTSTVLTSRSAGRIVAILPRGEAIRNFVQTGALGLVREQADLTVISVAPDAQTLDDLSNSCDRLLELHQAPEPYPVRLLRELLDLVHGRTLWSAAAQERWRLRDAEAKTLPARIKRVGKKLLATPLAGVRGVSLVERWERRISRLLSPSDHYIDLYRKIQPSLVFNGSHVHSVVAIQAVQAAQWLGIPTATFIFSWDNLTSQGRILPPYDYYLVWNDDLKSQLLRLYPSIQENKVIVTGTPQFDFHFDSATYWSREEFCQRVNADPTRPIVLYSTGMAEHMPGEPSIVERIADILTENESLRPQLLVRVYPKDETGRFEELRRRRPDILFPEARWISSWLTPTRADNQLLTNTLRHVDVGINVASTVSLELCMFDKPVINVAYDPPGLPAVRVPYARYYEFDHYKPVVASGGVQVAFSEDELRAQLKEALEKPQMRASQRKALMRSMFASTLDGRSHVRVADVLLKLATKMGGVQ